MKFTKWHGCGNDFVLIDAFDEAETDFAALAPKICQRHYGVGADGILVLYPSAKADLAMKIYNADGSEAEMCGNGIRCLARYAYEKGRTDKTEFSVATGAGIMVPKLIMKENKIESVQVDMGEPILTGDDIPVIGVGSGRIVNVPAEVGDHTLRITCVSMGNPHCVVFVDDAEDFPVEKYGVILETYRYFPRKTNVEFVEVRDEKHLRMRVWERGAGVTLACGTGACASLVAAVLNRKTEREAELELDGGKLQIRWDEDNHVYMTGPAEEVFSGEWIG